MYLDDGVFVKICIDDIVYKYFPTEKNMGKQDIINELKNIVEFLKNNASNNKCIRDYLKKLYSGPINKDYVSINYFNKAIYANIGIWIYEFQIFIEYNQ